MGAGVSSEDGRPIEVVAVGLGSPGVIWRKTEFVKVLSDRNDGQSRKEGRKGFGSGMRGKVAFDEGPDDAEGMGGRGV